MPQLPPSLSSFVTVIFFQITPLFQFIQIKNVVKDEDTKNNSEELDPNRHSTHFLDLTSSFHLQFKPPLLLKVAPSSHWSSHFFLPFSLACWCIRAVNRTR